jgi:hypothetical protein
MRSIWENGEARPAGDNAGKFPALVARARLPRKASETGGPIGAGQQLNTRVPKAASPRTSATSRSMSISGSSACCATRPFQDVGRAVHPAYVEGQMQGGAAQGIGWALSEEYIFDKNGKLDNASFLDYRMPVSSDLPMLDAVMIEIPNPKHPQGVRGVGEVPLVPPLAAVSNAI